MKFPGVLGVSGLRRTAPELALSFRAMWPSASNDSVGVLIATFRSSIPSPPVPLFTLHCVLRSTQCKTRGRADRYSFLVRLSHPLLHTGFIPALHLFAFGHTLTHHLIHGGFDKRGRDRFSVTVSISVVWD